MSTTSYHVYAIDGYESAHRTEAAAVKAAKRGAKLRRIEYRVYRTDRQGLTGGGHGTLVWSSAASEVTS